MARADRLLLVEGQPVAATARVVVQVVAHRPQENRTRCADLVRLARDEHAEAHQIAEALHPPAGARRPEGDVEIAQAARAVLHVGLEQVDRGAEALVALGDLVLESLHEEWQLAVAEDAAERALFEESAPAATSPAMGRQSSRAVAVGRSARAVSSASETLTTWCPMLTPASHSG